MRGSGRSPGASRAFGESGGGGYAPSLRSGAPVGVPEALLPGAEAARGLGKRGEGRYGVVILGAGAAGLSLCWYLLEMGLEERVLLLDRRERYEDDRTWCFWDVEETPFSHLAVRRWTSWSVRHAGRTVAHTSERHPYLCLAAADFYRHALAGLSAHENVALRLGEEVRGVKDLGDRSLVLTNRGSYEADAVFDGRGLPPGSPVFERARREAVWVPQKFLGLRVRARRAVFDPERCTLMDFSVSQARGLRFVYVLPLGEREALVENVYLHETEVSAGEHREEIRAYLRDRYGLFGDDFVVDGEERGYIPMTDYAFPRRSGRTLAVGMLGGETRPSTGYTFLRIQRYCRALAGSLVRGGGLPERTGPRRLRLLDAIFLRFMRERPQRCPGVYARMFSRVPPDPLVRFLTERSSPADEARLVLALPKTPFLGVASRMALSRAAAWAARRSAPRDPGG